MTQHEFITATLLVAGLWQVSKALIIKTSDLPSSLIFKVIPFAIGAACLIASGVLNGYILKM
jgi:hypothetical protein